MWQLINIIKNALTSVATVFKILRKDFLSDFPLITISEESYKSIDINRDRDKYTHVTIDINRDK